MNTISRSELKKIKLIESHFFELLEDETYNIEKIKALNLLTWNRLDVAFKLYFLEMLGNGVMFSHKMYIDHISAFSFGKFTEPGNKNKRGAKKFLEYFLDTFRDIEKNGFDKRRSLIPLSINCSIANGSHRLASAIFLDKDIYGVKIKTNNHIYDYNFFYKRKISFETLDSVVTKFIEYAPNTYIAILWPIGRDEGPNVLKNIPNIVYKKKIKLNPNGAHNLLSQVYYGEEWIGSVDNNFKGSNGKLIECFKTFESFEVIAFQAENLSKVLEIKEKIRKVFNVGKHSVHITDSKEEAVRLARVLFNNNSIHFLNYARPNTYSSTHEKLKEFKNFIKINDIDSSNILIDSSFVLSCYGIREANDTDFLCVDRINILNKFNDINAHDEELKYYDSNKGELIYNPENYFYFNGVKFLSFDKLYHMKKNRAEKKDINDLQIMKTFIENNNFKRIFWKINHIFLYYQIKGMSKIIKFLKAVKLYDIVRRIYYLLK
jgi:hypothetical protein